MTTNDLNQCEPAPDAVRLFIEAPVWDGTIVSRMIGECIHCGGEGCRDCEGDFDVEYPNDYESDREADRYEQTVLGGN